MHFSHEKKKKKKKRKSFFFTLTLKIFNENCYIPKNIHSDKEAGIINNKKLKELGINVYHTDFLGSPIAERCIRTLKTWIEPLRDKTPGRAWKQHLKTVVNRYNDNIHQTIKMTPNQAFYNLENDKILRANHIDFYKQEKDVPKTKLKIDDTVITLRQKGKFTKGYVRSWNTTKYKIKDIINSDPPMYKLSNGKNYYIQQLQKVEPEPEEKPKINIRKPTHIEYNGPASRTRSILRNKK